MTRPTRSDNAPTRTPRAPAKRTPVKRAPVKRAPAKRTPAKRTPAERAPAERAPADRLAPPPAALAPPSPPTPVPVPTAAAQDPAPAPTPPASPLRSRRGSVAGRAGLALALLVGYFVLAAALVGGLAFVTIQAFAAGTSGLLSTKLAVFTGIVAASIGRAVLTVERRGDDEHDGVPVSRSEQPELWRLVDEVSAELGVPAPDTLRLVDDVNAFVHQDTRLLGLVGGRRHMGIGVALLQVLTVDELRGVIAHELGHYAGGDTRLSALVHRAGSTVERTVLHLGPRSLLGWLFGLYARLYQRVSLAVRRGQELRADEGSVRVAGKAVHESALREAQAAGAAWGFFVDSYVVPLWQAGTAPHDLYVGFRALLDDPVREEQIDEVRRSDDGPAHPYDSHPPLGARVAHVRGLPDRTPPGDERAGRSLLRDAEECERRVTAEVNRRVLGKQPAQLAVLGEDLDAAPYTAGLGDDVAAVSRATAAVDGGGAPAGLGRTLALLEQGQDEALVTALTGDRRLLGDQARQEDLRAVVTGALARSAACALVDAGAAAWRASWSGPVRLVDARNQPLDLAEELDLVLEADGVAGLRPALVRAGVPLDDAALPAAAAVADVGEDDVIAVWPELSRGRSLFDGYVTRDLLVLVPHKRSWTIGIRRGVAAQYGIGRGSLHALAARRVQEVLDSPLAEVRQRPGVRAVRWDDVPAVGLKGGLSIAWVLTMPGQEKPFDKLKAQNDKLVPTPEQVAALLRQLVGDRLDSKS